VVDPHEFFSSPPPAFHCVVPVLLSVVVFLTLGAQGHLARFSRLLLAVSYASPILLVKRCLGVGI
jgi:hypothetical protein